MNSEQLLANLPPEVRDQVAAKLAQQQQSSQLPGGQMTPPNAVVRQPSLMDHLLALRQEVDMLRRENAVLTEQIAANSNVVEAVGQPVGQMYQMFQTTPNPSSTYSTAFQNQQVKQDGDDY